MSYAETQTLLQRMGELRSDKGDGNLWARGFSGRFDSFSQGKLSGFNMNYHGFQIGADMRLDAPDGDIYLGAMGGASNSSQSYSKGNGNGGLNSQNLGLYASYMQTDGLYADALLKYSHMKNSFNVYDSSAQRVSGNASTDGFSASLEAGKRFYLNTSRSGFYIEPQAQLTYSYQDKTTVMASNGLRIDLDSFNSTLGRASALIGYNLDEGSKRVNIYVKTGYVGEFAGNLSYSLNGSNEGHSNRGDWWNNGVGMSAQINSQHNIYLDLESSTGSKFNQRQVNAGYRLTF